MTASAIAGRRTRPALSRQPPPLALREAGDGTPLVLLHGLASSSRYWEDLRPLADWYRVVAPDLLGFGRSPKPADAAYTPAEHVAALRRALTGRLREPFFLLGHSLGSLIALHYAVAHPEEVRALVLVSLPVMGASPWGHTADGGMTRWHRFSVHSRSGDAVFTLGMRAVSPLWRVLGPRIRRTVPAEATRDALACSWQAYWRSLESVVFGTDVPRLSARVQAPVLMLHGPADLLTPVGPVRALAAQQPRLRLIEIAETGHNPYFVRRQATAAAIRSFLQEAEQLGLPETLSALSAG